jgi:hypothetical protein
MADPILRKWRIMHEIGIGEVASHPRIPDGWMTTSRVIEVADDCSWMRTKSRLYRLEDPFPNDAAMPAGARDAVLARILRNAGSVGQEEMNALIVAAEKIADKLTGLIMPKA